MAIERFYERMKNMLGDEEYESFRASLCEPAVRGFRINPRKICTPEDGLLPAFEYEALPYVDGGYVLKGEAEGIGNTAEHHAGAIYVQDPGAMATVAALDVPGDAVVCDLCAAPGGKTTQIAAKLDTGWLLANEYVPKRAKILVGNIERMGIRRAVVTSMDTGRLAELFDSVFDIVIADAPCSGEGMLRKDVPAEEEWTEDAPGICAKRQAEILDNAHGMVKAGGKLLYSTCTYSIEENEMAVNEFLDRHPEYRLIPVKDELLECTAPGIVYSDTARPELVLTRRFYPHKAKGEGQYIALMERTEAPKARFNYSDSSRRLSRDEDAAVKALFASVFDVPPKGKAVGYGNNIVFIEHGCPLPCGGVFSSGVLIGELRGKVLVPSHHFFSAYGDMMRIRHELKTRDEADRYLRGEQLKTDIKENGFAAVSFGGAVIGGGKISAGVLNNHYPKGLRKK